MSKVDNHIALTQHVLRTLLYYDIFNYPLKACEVFQFLGVNSITQHDVEQTLDDLTSEAKISRFGEYYSVQQRAELVDRRKKGNAYADTLLPLAIKRANFIAGFPFVRAVMASGSLSKNYMDEHSDLDFFIVTAPGRLWISRTLLVLYKRLFLRNSHKYFCVNYFIDTEHLEIEEKNLFTATELATVLPLYGAEYYLKLQEVNRPWLRKYFPNFKPRSTDNVLPIRLTTGKRFIEFVISALFGNVLEKFFMKTTLSRWKKLYRGRYNPEDFAVAFKTKKHASKNHPRHYQKSVMELYQQRVAEFEYKSTVK